MTPAYGIVLEWDEDGLGCCIWARMGARRLEFESIVHAQAYIDGMLELPVDRDVVAEPRRFV